MNTSNIIAWEDRLTRQAFALLLLATAYGIVVGAVISMYYAVTPNMDSLEDNLAPVQLILYLLAVIVSLFHLPMAVADAKHKLWKQASMRGVTFFGPLIIFLGVEGLISHFLWWLPISDTDQYHMLHHTVVAGIPLTLLYWLILRRWWRPNDIIVASSYSPTFFVVSGTLLVIIILPLGIMIGSFSLALILGAGVMTVVILPLLLSWRQTG